MYATDLNQHHLQFSSYIPTPNIKNNSMNEMDSVLSEQKESVWYKNTNVQVRNKGSYNKINLNLKKSIQYNHQLCPIISKSNVFLFKTMFQNRNNLKTVSDKIIQSLLITKHEAQLKEVTYAVHLVQVIKFQNKLSSSH